MIPPDLTQCEVQPSGSFEDSAFLQQIRTQMVKFAIVQLKDPHQADDAVQEALIGAMKNQSSI
jgi:DNA-directed RNA polymerase specialized sigma24 family protein